MQNMQQEFQVLPAEVLYWKLFRFLVQKEEEKKTEGIFAVGGVGGERLMGWVAVTLRVEERREGRGQARDMPAESLSKIRQSIIAGNRRKRLAAAAIAQFSSCHLSTL